MTIVNLDATSNGHKAQVTPSFATKAEAEKLDKCVCPVQECEQAFCGTQQWQDADDEPRRRVLVGAGISEAICLSSRP